MDVMQAVPPPFAPTLLLVDDDPESLRILVRALKGEPYQLLEASDGASALAMLEEYDVDLVITDLNMPGVSGIEFLERIRRSGRDVGVMIWSGHASVENVIQCLRLSAVDFLQKPIVVSDLRRRVQQILEKRLLERESRVFRDQLCSGSSPMLIGSSKAWLEFRELIRRAATAKDAVLLRGEKGTGKELVARALHQWSGRGREPFLSVDCATLSPAVVESELFGHVHGAFSGADDFKVGLFKAAGRGTVFLDEIADLPLELQSKLLRALQEHEIRPVGSSKAEPFEATIVAATARDLEELLKEGKFRQDLFLQLNVVTLVVPPLRKRAEDILELARHFLSRYDPTKGFREIDPKAAEVLRSYDWPGNVRELENCVRRLVALCPGALITADLPPPRPPNPLPDLQETELSDWEHTAVRSGLAAARGNVTQASRILGISKTTLYRKMKEFAIERTQDSRQPIS